MRQARGSAFDHFFDNLSAGDPTAIAIAIGFGLLVCFAAGVAIYDRRQRAKDGKKRREN